VPDWLAWLLVSAAFAAAETVSTAFVLIMVAGGAGAAAIAAGLGAGVFLQIVVAIAGTLALLWLVRPVAIRHLNPGPPAITGSDALVGHEAVVLRDVTREGGRVRLNGAEWSARAADPKQELTPGTVVTVLAIDGATAVVYHEPFQ
jgi:membrane protein implicated in regulation of membrane protease activity